VIEPVVEKGWASSISTLERAERTVRVGVAMIWAVFAIHVLVVETERRRCGGM
jgi:hypothetical protein